MQVEKGVFSLACWNDEERIFLASRCATPPYFWLQLSIALVVTYAKGRSLPAANTSLW